MIKLLLIALCFSFASCDYTFKLPGGYIFYSEAPSDQIIMKKEGIVGREGHVPCNVVEYDYNDDFIVAKQIARFECFFDKKNYFNQIEGGEYYWIIEVKQRKINGPYTEKKYWDKRTTLGVPKSLSVTKRG